MENFWAKILVNKALWAMLVSAFLAQGAKIVIGVLRHRKFNFYWLLGTGGMPSAHSAAVVSLTICIGKEQGVSSPIFAMSILFALITMFDAQTWRRSIGTQAKILNDIMGDLQEKRHIQEDRLRELVGHTPIEVFMGILIGAGVAFLLYL